MFFVVKYTESFNMFLSFSTYLIPANTPRGFHVETTWKQLFPRRFNVESTWCVCRDDVHYAELL